MTRSLAVVLMMLVVATTVAACGNASDDHDNGTVAAATSTTPRPPGDDAARATRALVTLADMPQEWSEEQGSVTRLHCGGFQPFRGSSVLVTSRRLTQDKVGLQERIALYPTAAAARRALARLDSRRSMDCVRGELQRHVSEEAGAPAKPARLLRKDRLGPRAHATVYMSTSHGQYGPLSGYIEVVHARHGRALAALGLVTGPARVDEDISEHVIRLILRRLEAMRG